MCCACVGVGVGVCMRGCVKVGVERECEMPALEWKEINMRK